MKDFKKNLKAFVLLLGLAMMFPFSASAQYYEGSLLRDNPSTTWQRESLMNTRDALTWSIVNNGIGQSESPLGSGIAILIGAGLGYVALKKKEDKQ